MPQPEGRWQLGFRSSYLIFIGVRSRSQVVCDVAERVFLEELHPRAERRADLFGPFLVVVEPL